MLPATWISARRRTILVFYYNPQTKTYKKLAVARYSVGNEIKAAWDMKAHPDQWDALTAIVTQYQPKKIGINTSVNFGHADGLDHTEYETFKQKLPASYQSKLVSSEPLAVAWLETRTEREMQFYPQLIKMSKDIIAKGFSSKVITPGITTTEDLVWWYRQEIIKRGFTTWFHPSVEIQRNDSVVFDHLTAFTSKGYNGKDIIMQGDLLHVDFGITYLRLNTDIQEHAYVLKPNETNAPLYLPKAIETGKWYKVPAFGDVPGHWLRAFWKPPISFTDERVGDGVSNQACANGALAGCIHRKEAFRLDGRRQRGGGGRLVRSHTIMPSRVSAAAAPPRSTDFYRRQVLLPAARCPVCDQSLRSWMCFGFCLVD